jgi:hypothetical protein
MGEIRIHLRFNKETGKKDILIKYDGEEDALPYEHEQRHRQIVEELIGKGVLDAEDVGQVRVGHNNDQKAPPTAQDAQQPEAQTQGE